MLGNFSFGDYFKERAIPLAWELLTKDYGLDPKRLTITVYHTDDEAYGIWKKLTGFGDDKIIRIATADNFWQMGDTGPCGPCSEIFFDHGDKIFGGPPGSKDADGDRFVEIWNLVFMQFEQLPGGERVDLPKQSVDTGMGLERIAAVLQGVTDNYDIDLFKALIAASVQATGVAASGDNKASHRVIADHLRATSFLIADGVLPSNEGRGYVLRRIMRRAMRHAHLLGAEEPLMYRLVPALVHEMGDTYHELQRAQPLITETLHAGRDALQEDAREGPRPARRSVGQAQEGRRPAGRDGVQALRHLRLPARPHRGCAARARRHCRHQGFRSRHGAAEGGSAQGLEGLRRGGDGIDLVRGEGEDRRHRVPRLRGGDAPRARSSRSSRTARKPRR